MYREYFGLKEMPFSISPDPRYLYMSQQHREALGHLIYGINCESGFVLLTGEVGTGKTTLCRCLLQQMPETCTVAFILNPRMTVDELLATICDELRIEYPEGTKSIKVLIDRINQHLLAENARGRKTVLILEEAQNLSTDILEQVRLLTNLETDQHKLLQVIMIGQPELKDKLNQPDLLQLSQRITARYHLGPLRRDDVTSYVWHRLSVAGGRPEIFPESVMAALCRLSGGIPRVINLICDRALLGTYAQCKRIVDRRTLARASSEVLGGLAVLARAGSSKRRLVWGFSTLFMVSCAAALLLSGSDSLRLTRPAGNDSFVSADSPGRLSDSEIYADLGTLLPMAPFGVPAAGPPCNDGLHPLCKSIRAIGPFAGMQWVNDVSEEADRSAGERMLLEKTRVVHP